MAEVNKMINSRRNFMRNTAASAVSLGATGLIGSSVAVAASSSKSIGNGPFPTEGMAAYSPKGPHKLIKFSRRALGPKDVAIELHYCGICHSDIHTIREDWGKSQFPLITGHELTGVVIAIGSSVNNHKIGDRVGVGPMVNSCKHCPDCEAGLEQYCETGLVTSYGSKDRDGSITQGGYSRHIVVDEDFVLKVPANMDLAHAGPLMCAGITVYSPLRRWSVGQGQKVAVIGFGGLGHLGVQLANAIGAEITVFTTSKEKVEDAKRLGAKEVVVYQDGDEFKGLSRKFHFILDTAPYAHNLDRFFDTLKRDGTLCRVGVGKLSTPNEIGQMSLVQSRRSFASSMIGGIRETQDLIDFCASKNIRPEITKIGMNEIDVAWDRVVAKKARYRFVIDLKA